LKWCKAKLIFFEATGVKKPKSKTFWGKIDKPSQGLDKALNKVDKSIAAYDKTLEADRKAADKRFEKGKGYKYSSAASAFEKMAKAIANFQSLKTGYLKVLAVAGTQTPPEVKDGATYKQAVTLLEQQLKYIESALKFELSSRASVLKQIQEGARRVNSFAVVGDNLMANIRGVIDKAQVFIARARVTRELERDWFVKALSKAARDISVTVNNIEMLAKKNKDFRLPVGDPPEGVREKLNAWHTGGNQRELPKDADREDMLNELAVFEVLVNELDRWAG
jgi:hypothetical protein